MEKKYNYQEFRKDPRTSNSRANQALYVCIESNKTTPEEIFTAVDKAYSLGKHRSPSYIKQLKVKTLRLFSQFVFE